MVPVLMPSLLSGLTGNIGGLEQPGILTLSASFEAGGSMGGLAEIPLKSEAAGPSHEVDLIPPMPASKEEVPKCEPSSQGTSHRDSPVLDVNPEDIAEIIIDDGDDLNWTIEEPQAISTSPHQWWSQLFVGSGAQTTRVLPHLPPRNAPPKRKVLAHHPWRKTCLKG